jgi:hypothetical protein
LPSLLNLTEENVAIRTRFEDITLSWTWVRSQSR